MGSEYFGGRRDGQRKDGDLRELWVWEVSEMKNKGGERPKPAWGVAALRGLWDPWGTMLSPPPCGQKPGKFSQLSLLCRSYGPGLLSSHPLSYRLPFLGRDHAARRSLGARGGPVPGVWPPPTAGA